jgi:hypothetical protein
MLAGVLLALTILGAPVGIPLGVLGLLLLVRALFGAAGKPLPLAGSGDLDWDPHLPRRCPVPRSLYSVHPSIPYARAILDNLPEKTGRSLIAWVRLVKREGPQEAKEQREWLRRKHGLGATTAWMLADQAAGKGAEDTDPEAYLKAATRTRIDLGLALKGAKGRLPQRLLATGGAAKGDRITHRIPLSGAAEIDGEVLDWLRRAYELDAVKD